MGFRIVVKMDRKMTIVLLIIESFTSTYIDLLSRRFAGTTPGCVT